MTKRFLTRAQILEAKDLKFEDVKCPEWAPEGESADDCVLRIRSLSAIQRGVFIQRASAAQRAKKASGIEVTPEEEKQTQEIEIFLVSISACGEDMKLIFTQEDIAALAEKNAAPIARCAAVAQRLSGLTEEAVAEIEKKSDPAPSGDSSSD